MLAQGICEDRFLEVKNIFNNLLETKQETGAAFSVIQNKKKLLVFLEVQKTQEMNLGQIILL